MRILLVMDVKGDSAHCVPMKPVAALISALLAAAFSSAPAQAGDDWANAPQTPGNWRLALLPAGSTATFRAPDGQALFTLACVLQNRLLVMTRHTVHTAPPPQGLMQVQTQTHTRTLIATASGGGDGAIGASLAASDALFDAMAVSRGRFAVEVEGSDALYLPAWAEVTRVIEDCR